MKELLQTIQSLEELDNNTSVILRFLEEPERHFHVVDMMLKEQITKLFDKNKPMVEVYRRYDEVINLVNDKWWGNTYPVHDHHFHKSFEAFCNCPFTCLTEIIDCLRKISQGNQQ